MNCERFELGRTMLNGQGAHGMQGVRGSNPRTSTKKALWSKAFRGSRRSVFFKNFVTSATVATVCEAMLTAMQRVADFNYIYFHQILQ
jgi:hypothetical protein